MSVLVPPVQTAPFAPVPQPLRAAGAGSLLRLRRFGTCLPDLEIDLDSDDLPATITNVLAACAILDGDSDSCLDLPVGTRTAGLLILAMLDGADAIDVEITCDACGQPLEVSLTIDELLERERSALDAVPLVTDAGAIVEVRRPTGRDQALWAAGIYSDERAAREAMATRLSGRDETDPASVDRIEDALERADPLIRTAVETCCPDCGRHAGREVDVASAVLVRLRRAQDALIETVHSLATRYHWSEADIVAMPSWRRARYAAHLSRERS